MKARSFALLATLEKDLDERIARLRGSGWEEFVCCFRNLSKAGAECITSSLVGVPLVALEKSIKDCDKILVEKICALEKNLQENDDLVSTAFLALLKEARVVFENGGSLNEAMSLKEFNNLSTFGQKIQVQPETRKGVD